MIKIGDIFFPDRETHFQQFEQDIDAYQRPGRLKAYDYVRCFDLAVDIGANVGIFSRGFASRFKHVCAIEPLPENLACLRRNLPQNAYIVDKAIGDRPGKVTMFLPLSSLGGAFVTDHEDIDLPFDYPMAKAQLVETEMITLDSLGLSSVGLIKLDIQGAEAVALRGAEDTIRRCKPVILIEEKPGGQNQSTRHISEAQALLRNFGMVAKERVGADRIYVFPGPEHG